MVLEDEEEDSLDRSCEYYRVKEERNILHTFKKEEVLPGLVTS